jgi:hypothetical protein
LAFFIAYKKWRGPRKKPPAALGAPVTLKNASSVRIRSALLISALHSISKDALEVHRLAPTYKCRQVKWGLSVSKSLTPAKLSP